jgi:hypothetical protein
MVKITKPVLGAASFNCPHCGALASQQWFDCFCNEALGPPKPIDQMALQLQLYRVESLEQRNAQHERLLKMVAGYIWLDKDKAANCYLAGNLRLSQCFSCKEIGVWSNDKLIFPKSEVLSTPNEDMPVDIAAAFKEAASIAEYSPRGAAALLRLCVQLLCKQLGEKGENINNDIGNLVRKGLSQKIQQALDVVRVVGNNAVHPGQIDLADDVETAHSLFSLVNVIVETMISQPKRIEDAYMQLPETARAAIEKRDVETGRNAKSDS